MRTAVLLCLLLWIGSTAFAKPIPGVFTVDDRFTASTLLGSLFLFSDDSHHIHIGDILADSMHRYSFKPVHDEILNMGFDPRAHWIKCQIRNEGHKTQALVFGLDYFEIDSLSFFVVDSANQILYRQEQVSRKTPIADRPIAARYFAFPVSIQPQQTLTLYVRVFRRNSVLLLPFKLFTKKAFLTDGFSFDFVYLLGIGILLIAFLTSFALYLATKKKVLLYYSGFAFCYCIISLSLEGVWSQYTDISFLDENTKLVMGGLGAFFQLNFTLEFLQLAGQKGKHWERWVGCIRLFALLSLVSGFYVLVTPFTYASAALLSAVGIIVQLVVLGLIISGLAARRYEAVLYLIGFLPFLMLMLWLGGNVIADIPRNWLFYQLAYASPFVQLMVLGVGVGLKLIREQEASIVAVSSLKQQQAKSIIQTQESERQRIAADLHDDLGGTLATIRRRISDIRLRLRDAQVVNDLDELQPLIQKSSDDLRRISHNLMPPEFARIGLCHAIRQLVSNQPDQPTQYSFVTAGIEQRLSLETELNLYRIVSELIQNIGKHAQARRAAIQVLYHNDQLTITVEDDGLGNRSLKTADEHIGIGLKNSNLRADYIGAKLRRNVSEAGTLIVLDVVYSTTTDAGGRTEPNSTD